VLFHRWIPPVDATTEPRSSEGPIGVVDAVYVSGDRGHLSHVMVRESGPTPRRSQGLVVAPRNHGSVNAQHALSRAR
jgi:hypothetical protein